MEDWIDEEINFFTHKQKKLFDCLKDNYIISKHNEFYEVVDILKDLYEIKKVMSGIK